MGGQAPAYLVSPRRNLIARQRPAGKPIVVKFPNLQHQPGA